MFDVIVITIAAIITFFTGTIIEKKHYRSIRRREKEILDIPFLTTGKYDDVLPHNPNINVQKIGDEYSSNLDSSELVKGSVVIGVDYFSTLLFALRNFFGGKVSVFERLTDRARREAILRMRTSAQSADAILNMRLHTSEVGTNQVEVIAYGTAIYLKK